MDNKYIDLDFAKLDIERQKRRGYSEAVFCESKTTEQLIKIFDEFKNCGQNVIGTRVMPEQAKALGAEFKINYNETARIITLIQHEIEKIGEIAVCTGGTGDIPIAEEAAETAEFYGSNVKRYYDIGVAGIHRLFDKIDDIRKANVVIAIAGMEGALGHGEADAAQDVDHPPLHAEGLDETSGLERVHGGSEAAAEGDLKGAALVGEGLEVAGRFHATAVEDVAQGDAEGEMLGDGEVEGGVEGEQALGHLIVPGGAAAEGHHPRVAPTPAEAEDRVVEPRRLVAGPEGDGVGREAVEAAIVRLVVVIDVGIGQVERPIVGEIPRGRELEALGIGLAVVHVIALAREVVGHRHGRVGLVDAEDGRREPERADGVEAQPRLLLHRAPRGIEVIRGRRARVVGPTLVVEVRCLGQRDIREEDGPALLQDVIGEPQPRGEGPFVDVVHAVVPIGAQPGDQAQPVPLRQLLHVQADLLLARVAVARGLDRLQVVRLVHHAAPPRGDEAAPAADLLHRRAHPEQQLMLHPPRLELEDGILPRVECAVEPIPRRPLIAVVLRPRVEAHVRVRPPVVIAVLALEEGDPRAQRQPVRHLPIHPEGSPKGHEAHPIPRARVRVIPAAPVRLPIERPHPLVGRLVAILIEEVQPQLKPIQQTERQARRRRNHPPMTRRRRRPPRLPPLIRHRQPHRQPLLLQHLVHVRRPLQSRARRLRVRAPQQELPEILLERRPLRPQDHRSPRPHQVRQAPHLAPVGPAHRPLHDVHPLQQRRVQEGRHPARQRHPTPQHLASREAADRVRPRLPRHHRLPPLIDPRLQSQQLVQIRRVPLPDEILRERVHRERRLLRRQTHQRPRIRRLHAIPRQRRRRHPHHLVRHRCATLRLIRGPHACRHHTETKSKKHFHVANNSTPPPSPASGKPCPPAPQPGRSRDERTKKAPASQRGAGAFWEPMGQRSWRAMAISGQVKGLVCLVQ